MQFHKIMHYRLFSNTTLSIDWHLKHWPCHLNPTDFYTRLNMSYLNKYKTTATQNNRMIFVFGMPIISSALPLILAFVVVVTREKQ